jgi:cellobiose-specific phosphotransferase system component IIC
VNRASKVALGCLTVAAALYFAITGLKDHNLGALLLLGFMIVLVVARRVTAGREMARYLPGALVGLVMLVTCIGFAVAAVRECFNINRSDGLIFALILGVIATGIFAGLMVTGLVKLVRAGRVAQSPRNSTSTP